MSNTPHGPYVVGGSTTTGPYHDAGPYNSGNANNAETQASVALHSLNPDLLTSGFVLSGVTSAKDGTTASQLDVASGVAYLIVSDGTLARMDVGASAAGQFSTTGHASTTMYLDLNPDGSWSWATTHSAVTNHLTIASVATDASANISTVTDARPLATSLLSPAQGLHVGQPAAAGSGVTQSAFRMGGAVSSYGNDSFIGTYADVAGGGGAFLYLVLAADKGLIVKQQSIGGGNLFAVGITPTAGAKSWIDSTGALSASAPVTLTSGNQETGHCAVGGVPTSTNPFGGGVNFKTVMTNAPTSLTLAVADSANIASTTADHIDKYGFTFQVNPTAANTYTKWSGTYTTVGNCLLALDATAQTFDHHCDACGHLSLATPFDALQLQPAPIGPALAFACPSCGASEHFNVALTSADELDTAPQGAGAYQTTRGAQAALIRALMRALEMAVAL